MAFSYAMPLSQDRKWKMPQKLCHLPPFNPRSPVGMLTLHFHWVCKVAVVRSGFHFHTENRQMSMFVSIAVLPLMRQSSSNQTTLLMPIRSRWNIFGGIWLIFTCRMWVCVCVYRFSANICEYRFKCFKLEAFGKQFSRKLAFNYWFCLVLSKNLLRNLFVSFPAYALRERSYQSLKRLIDENASVPFGCGNMFNSW